MEWGLGWGCVLLCVYSDWLHMCSRVFMCGHGSPLVTSGSGRSRSASSGDQQFSIKHTSVRRDQTVWVHQNHLLDPEAAQKLLQDQDGVRSSTGLWQLTQDIWIKHTRLGDYSNLSPWLRFAGFCFLNKQILHGWITLISSWYRWCVCSPTSPHSPSIRHASTFT